MARSHEPPNGADHPPQNGTRAKQVAIALFMATTFGIMAILSFPISGVIRPLLHLPHPLEAALSPAERVLRPLIPWLGLLPPSGPPKKPLALGPRRPPVVVPGPARPTAPGVPGSGPPAPPPPPPSGGRLTLPSDTLTRPVPMSPPTLVKQLRGILSDRTTRLSPREARLVRAKLAQLRSACRRSGPWCARQLKRLEKLFHRLSARLDGHHGNRDQKGHGHRGRHYPHGEGSSGRSEGDSPKRRHGHGHGPRRGHGGHAEQAGHHGHRKV